MLTQAQADEVKRYVDTLVGGGLTGAECRGVQSIKITPLTVNAGLRSPDYTLETLYEVCASYVYPDGRLGVEIVVIDTVGKIVDSQDFG